MIGSATLPHGPVARPAADLRRASSPARSLSARWRICRQDALAGLELDDALGMARVGDRAEPEEHDRELRSEPERRRAARRRSRSPSAAFNAPSTVRDPRVTTRTTQTIPRIESVSARRRVLELHRQQPAAEPGDRGREREQHDAEAHGVDADRRRGRVAATQRGEVPTGRALADQDHHEPDDGEHAEHEQEPDVLVLGAQSGRGISMPETPPMISSRRKIVLSAISANASVASDR